MYAYYVSYYYYYHLINDGESIRGKLVPTVSLLVQIEKKIVNSSCMHFFKNDIDNNII